MFSNPTAADITKTITYYTDLGNDHCGIFTIHPAQATEPLPAGTEAKDDRDIGYVFGNAASVTLLRLPHSNSRNGNDDVYSTYDITVPAGGKVAIVNFLLMSGTDTGQAAADITALATDIDTVAADIVANFRTDTQYRRGMTQDQIDAIVNF